MPGSPESSPLAAPRQGMPACAGMTVVYRHWLVAVQAQGGRVLRGPPRGHLSKREGLKPHGKVAAQPLSHATPYACDSNAIGAVMDTAFLHQAKR